jgi:hypothetical protein
MVCGVEIIIVVNAYERKTPSCWVCVKIAEEGPLVEGFFWTGRSWVVVAGFNIASFSWRVPYPDYTRLVISLVDFPANPAVGRTSCRCVVH